ncbi:MAG: hypothetical protein E6J68_00420 [Deltaproteobacteria bacterium]|nr:MAG: hypothetical protein E6J68_00420 [Deltaproteobacteria bacterium]
MGSARRGHPGGAGRGRPDGAPLLRDGRPAFPGRRAYRRRRPDGRVRLPRAGADGRPVDDAARRAVPPRTGGGRLGGPRRRLLDDAGVALLRVGLAVSLTVEDLLRRVDLLAGPYSSGLTRAVAPIAEAHGVVLWNHGGAADDIHAQRLRAPVGILTPASRYFEPALRWIPDGPVLVLCRRASGFSAAVTAGAEAAARRQGRPVRIAMYSAADTLRRFVARLAAEPPALLLAAGRFEDDVALAGILSHGARPPTVLVAAGVRQFGEPLGVAANGFVGPSQWQAGADVVPDLGPSAAHFVRRFTACFGVAPDYPAAQAYAAGVVMSRCVELAGTLEQERLRAAAATLDCTTLFGRFRIDPVTGLQTGHEMLLVEWMEGRPRVVPV